MPFPWEEQVPAAMRVARSLRPPPVNPLDDFFPGGHLPAEAAIPPPMPDEPGMLEDIGDFLDRFTGDNLTRAFAAGEAGKGLRSIVPFGETLGIYDRRRDHVSGQDVNKTLFGIEPEGDLLSGAGGAGLATELALSPSNLLPGFMGLKSLTKGGRAVKVVGTHLDDAGRVAAAAERASKNMLARSAAERIANGTEDLLARAPTPFAKHPLLGDLFIDGARVGDRELVERLAKVPGPAGEAARDALELAGQNGDGALRMLPGAGDRVRAGQEALFSVGGEFNPFAILGVGGKYNPLNHTPLTKPWFEVPTKTIIEGADTADRLQKIGRGIADFASPVTDPIAQLFRKIPGVSRPTGEHLERALDESINTRSAGTAEALERAKNMDAEVKGLRTGPAPVKETEERLARRLRIEEQLEHADAHTGEVLDLTPEEELMLNQPPSSAALEAFKNVKPMGDDELLARANARSASAPADLIAKTHSDKTLAAPLGNIPEGFMPDVPAPQLPEILQQRAAPQYAKLNKAADVLAGVEQRLGVQPFDLERGLPSEPTPKMPDVPTSLPKADPVSLNAMPPAEIPLNTIQGRLPLEPGAPPLNVPTPLELPSAAAAAPSLEAQGIANLSARVEGLNTKLRGGNYPGKGKDLVLVRQLEEMRNMKAARLKVSESLAATGEQIDEAARRSAKLLPDDIAPDAAKRITQYLEHGGNETEEIVSSAEQIRARYDTLFEAEKTAGLDVQALKSDRLNYTTHVSTEAGQKFFKSLGNAKKQAAVFKALEEARIAKGLAENPDALLPRHRQQLERAMRPDKPDGPYKGVGKNEQNIARTRLFKLDEDTKAFIVNNSLVQEYLDFSNAIASVHGSMVPRLDAYQNLGVSELNAVFQKFGAPGVFNENPAAQLFAREARHAKAMAGVAFFEKASELGNALPNRVGTEVPGKGVEIFSNGSVGVSEMNRQRVRQGLPPMSFDPSTAQAIADTYNKLANPAEVGPLLRWYDDATRTMKSWVTRGFPAYHVRNHIGNRLQSFLGNVPVSGEHYELANKIVAGKAVEFNVSGQTFNREGALDVIRKNGVSRGGWFENLVEESLDQKKPTWNPLDPENMFIKSGERVGAAISGGAGQFAAGASNNLGNMSGRIVEDVDRVGHFLYKWMNEGLAPAEAAKSVDKYLFNYSKEAMSPFEGDVASRAVFFYGYTRQVIPMMLDALLNNTAKVKQMSQFAMQPGGPENTPAFARGGINIPLGKDAEGNSLISYSQGTPLEAALEPISGFSEGPGRGIAKIMSSLNPLMKAPLEFGSGQDFFLGKPIEDARKAPHWVEDLPEAMQNALGVVKIPKKDGSFKYEMDPDILWALRNSPLSRVSNTLSRGTDDKKGALENMLNLLTGSRIVSIDDEEEKARAQKAAIRAKLRELEHEGKVRSPEIYTADVAGKGDPEVKALLKALSGK